MLAVTCWVGCVQVEEADVRRLANLARLTATLITFGAMPPSVLKVRLQTIQ